MNLLKKISLFSDLLDFSKTFEYLLQKRKLQTSECWWGHVHQLLAPSYQKQEIIIPTDERECKNKMNYFEFSDRVNQNKQLSLLEKVILNQVLSYQLNNKEFFGTNEYLADYWNTSVSTIKRAFTNLNSFQLIERKRERKKHQNGNQSWYNKRYVTIDLDQLQEFLSVETPKKEIVVPPSQPLAKELPRVSTTIITNEPIDFAANLDEQEPQKENEFTRAFETKIGLAYDYQSMLELTQQDDRLSITATSKFPLGIPTDDYLQGSFHYVVMTSDQYREKYRAIISKNKRAA